MDGQARQVLDRLAALTQGVNDEADDAAWLPGFRYRTSLLCDFSGDAMPLAAVTLRTLADVPARIYGTLDLETPVLFHVHGGGGIAGTLDAYDPALRRLAARTGWTVVAPDYRLAPENRFPAQLDDSDAALIALASETPERAIVVSGDSIGGTIATAIAMRAHQRSGPRLTGQLLFYPNTDLRHDADYPSRRSEDGNVIAIDDLERQIDLYLARDTDRSDPQASPIMMRHLEGLPPTLIVTCENDPLRDEGNAYAQRLIDAGIALDHRSVPGMIHAFLQMAGTIDAVDTTLADVERWLGSLR